LSAKLKFVRLLSITKCVSVFSAGRMQETRPQAYSKRTGTMTDIQSLQSSPAAKAMQHPPVTGAQPAPNLPAKPVVAMPERAQIVAPKAIDIKYNPAETLQKLEDAVSMLNAQVEKHSLRVNFSIDKSLSTPIVTMRDAHSGDVIRQFPSEQTIAMAHSIDALKGMLHSSQA